MQKKTTYANTEFPADVLKEASRLLAELAHKPAGNPKRTHQRLSVEIDGAEWTHDSEAEFFADCQRSMADVHFVEEWKCEDRATWMLEYFTAPRYHVHVHVTAPTRHGVQSISNVFDRTAIQYGVTVIDEQPPVVFIGHGGSASWRNLKDHLQDKHGLDVEAYEIGARAGHAIRDVLENMLQRSSIAFLVMAAEDETVAGEMRARQNVVHETGLFQGKLGSNRAIAVVEEGTEVFSNIHGVQQIRFPKCQIETVFGDVLATIRREFPSGDGSR